MHVGAIKRVAVHRVGPESTGYKVELENDDEKHGLHTLIVGLHRDRAISVATAVWEACDRIPELKIGA